MIPADIDNFRVYYIADLPFNGICVSKRIKYIPKEVGNCSMLTKFRVTCNKIEDISGLSNCRLLSILDLCCNKVKNISALSNCINLTNLDIGGNKITDIHALLNCKNLTHLNIGTNKIINIPLPLKRILRL